MIGLALLFYAVPRLPFGAVDHISTGFSVIWLCFAFIVVGANLHHALGLDFEEQERRRRETRILHEASRWRAEGGKREWTGRARMHS